MKSIIERVLPADFRRFERDDVEGSITERFARIVEEYGSRIAIEDGDLTLTYAELDRDADRIAQTLLHRFGPQPEPIAMIYHPGAEFHKALFGVLKSGKFYANLDPELRPEKQRELIVDLGARVILCDAEMFAMAQTLGEQLEEVSIIDTGRLEPLDANVQREAHSGPDSYACVIYTSGSTGPPVGVLLSHRAVLHRTMRQTNSMHVRKEDRASQVCPLSSATCVGETLPILLNGATLLPFRVKARGIRELGRWLVEKKITVYVSVPTLFRLLLRNGGGDQFPDMRFVRLSGDRILKTDFELFQQHFSDSCLFRGAFGSSECGLTTQFYMHRSDSLPRELVPAGYVDEDVNVFIVDDDLKRVVPGEPGEIAVEGRYLAVGYWNNEKLTAERFIPSSQPDSKIYLTRDVGYLQGDGCLIHLGRKDARVKVYGKMVMLTDLEESLLKLPEIENAVVVPVMNEGADTALVAYYVTRGEASPTHDTIREHLLAQFPIEVTPKRFVRLAELPVTDRNKVDRRRLMSDGARSFTPSGPAGARGGNPSRRGR